MNAYSQLYLNDAMCTLGEMLDYAVNDCRYILHEADISKFMEIADDVIEIRSKRRIQP